MKMLSPVVLIKVGQLIFTCIIHSFSEGSYVMKKNSTEPKPTQEARTICNEKGVYSADVKTVTEQIPRTTRAIQDVLKSASIQPDLEDVHATHAVGKVSTLNLKKSLSCARNQSFFWKRINQIDFSWARKRFWNKWSWKNLSANDRRLLAASFQNQCLDKKKWECKHSQLSVLVSRSHGDTVEKTLWQTC